LHQIRSQFKSIPTDHNLNKFPELGIARSAFELQGIFFWILSLWR